MENSQRLRLRNRQIFCRYGVGPAEADAVFNLQVAGWTAEQVAALLRRANEAVATGVDVNGLFDAVTA